MRKHVATVALAAAVFGCGGDWFQTKRPGGVELLITELDVPHWADWGETIRVENTIYNYGTSRVAEEFTVKFYLSQDEDYDVGADVVLDFRTIGAGFEGGAEDEADTRVTLPGTGTDRSYYIIAYVDADTDVEEIRYGEDNNTLVAGPLMVYTPPDGVDLVMKYVSGPSGAEWGDPIRVDYTVRNRGTQDCTDRFEVSLYLSDDEVLDDGDSLLGTDDVFGLLALGDQPGTAFVQIPATGTDGYYYIIGEVNSGDSPVLEFDDAGEPLMANDKASDETIYVANLPDLHVLALSFSAGTHYWGDQISVDVQIDEIRGYASPPGKQIEVGLWLSLDMILDDGDQALGTIWTGPLGGLETRLLNTTVSLNKDPAWTGGSYHIIAKVNPSGEIVEKDGNNNTKWGSILISDPATDMYEPNNSSSSAYDLGSGPMYTSVLATIFPTGDEDWFRIYVPGSWADMICPTLYPPTDADYDLYLYDSSLYLVDWETNFGNGWTESMHYHYAWPGTYYLRVVGKTTNDYSNLTYQLYVNIW